MSQSSLGGAGDLKPDEKKILAAEKRKLQKRYSRWTACIAAVLLIALTVFLRSYFGNGIPIKPEQDTASSETTRAETTTPQSGETEASSAEQYSEPTNPTSGLLTEPTEAVAKKPGVLRRECLGSWYTYFGGYEDANENPVDVLVSCITFYDDATVSLYTGPIASECTESYEGTWSVETVMSEKYTILLQLHGGDFLGYSNNDEALWEDTERSVVVYAEFVGTGGKRMDICGLEGDEVCIIDQAPYFLDLDYSEWRLF